MPIYDYACGACEETTTVRRDVEQRNLAAACSCGGLAFRRFSAPHMAAIPGIYNRVNRNWKETGQLASEKWADIPETPK